MLCKQHYHNKQHDQLSQSNSQSRHLIQTYREVPCAEELRHLCFSELSKNTSGCPCQPRNLYLKSGSSSQGEGSCALLVDLFNGVALHCDLRTSSGRERMVTGYYTVEFDRQAGLASCIHKVCWWSRLEDNCEYIDW